MDPRRKVQNLTSSSATLTVLIFAFLFKGLLSQKTEHDLTVPASVTVQHGLCVHIPCSFTSGKIGSEKLYGYWFVKIDGYWEYFVTSFGVQTIHGTVVATNDKRIALPSFVRNRFNFTGNVNEGNCSLSILNAKSQDTGQYYFRIESSKVLFSYNTKPHMLLKVVVTELTEKPQIRNSSVVVPGTEAVFTCSAPGPCLKVNLKITWSTVLLGYRTLHWSQQNSDGSWTHGSDFIFTPSAGDRGKQLTCWVWYPNIDKRVQNTILLDFADSSHSDKSVVNKTWRGTSASRHNESLGTSVTLFLILLYLFKLSFCFLFFLSVFWLFDWRGQSIERGEQ